jgi:hypothetical protein
MIEAAILWRAQRLSREMLLIYGRPTTGGGPIGRKRHGGAGPSAQFGGELAASVPMT